MTVTFPQGLFARLCILVIGFGADLATLGCLQANNERTGQRSSGARPKPRAHRKTRRNEQAVVAVVFAFHFSLHCLTVDCGPDRAAPGWILEESAETWGRLISLSSM